VIFLSTVEDSFQLPNIGCVLIMPAPNTQLRPHDPIQLRTPDGRVIDTYVAAFPMVCGPDVRKDVVAFQLPTIITKQDVPKETEIWLAIDESS